MNDYLDTQTSNTPQENINDLKSWLLSADCIYSVEIVDGWIETLPPQQEIKVEYLVSGSAKTIFFDIWEFETGRIAFNTYHE